MVDAAPIRDAERAIMAAGEAGPVRALVATASHCHGAAAMLAIGPPPSGSALTNHTRNDASDG
jgi:hypothetical protein